MRTNYVLIDYENVQPANLHLLSAEHFRVVVFVGQSQQAIKTDLAIVLQQFGQRACYVQISGNGPNALDFHIAYYIGRLIEKDSSAFFHIISRDTGFDPLIVHLRQRKIGVHRSCAIDQIPLLNAQQSTVTTAAVQAQSSPLTPVSPATSAAPSMKPPPIIPAATAASMPPSPLDVVVASLKKMSKNLPQSEKALAAHVSSLLRTQDASRREDVVRQLVERKIVSISGSQLRYALPA